MKNRWKVLWTFLLCNLAVTAWAADVEGERRQILPAFNDNGVLLDVRGVFEVKELVGRFIVLYQDPTDGRFYYSLQEGPTTGDDVLAFGDLELAVTLTDGGGLKTVEVWEKDGWSTAEPLATKATKNGGTNVSRPLPDFDQVPKAWRPCEQAEYQFSKWEGGCLVDYFNGCPPFFYQGTVACCDGGVDPSGKIRDNCQDFGVLVNL